MAACGLGPARRHVHAGGGARSPIVNKEVDNPVGIPRDEVGGLRGESDIAPVGADGRLCTIAAHGLGAAAGDAHALGGALNPVVDKDVGELVGIPGDEVGGLRDEGDITAIGADGGMMALAAKGLVSLGGDVGTDSSAGLAVVDKDVDESVGIAAHEVYRGRLKGDKAAVGADRGR